MGRLLRAAGPRIVPDAPAAWGIASHRAGVPARDAMCPGGVAARATLRDGTGRLLP
ncbi:MAG: hypothetical protein O9972_49015 [Burkholderiales bacterium]|nr:hypothetical protein [Burkholderiales bacterium]